MSVVQTSYSRRKPPTKKTIWLVVDDPIHSEYDEAAFPSAEDLVEELKQKARQVLSAHADKSSKQWSRQGPANTVRAGMTDFGSLRMFVEVE